MPLALFPVDPVALALGEPARVADAGVVEVHGSLAGPLGVLIFDRRVRPLIRDHAVPAVHDLGRQAVERVRARIVSRERTDVDRARKENSLHASPFYLFVSRSLGATNSWLGG